MIADDKDSSFYFTVAAVVVSYSVAEYEDNSL